MSSPRDDTTSTLEGDEDAANLIEFLSQLAHERAAVGKDISADNYARAAKTVERLAGEVERYRFALEYIRVCADPKAVPKLANDALCISGHEWDSGAHPYCLNCGIPKGEGSS
ncbi:hypothetical protein LCGC14_2011130 [marine sediment metagenome]|uniref:Uncharacterized protein n=1 Tax=marine sediment metagenome TaxID=412755 RepID=A0A0F9HDQ3_9ZZZZ